MHAPPGGAGQTFIGARLHARARGGLVLQGQRVADSQEIIGPAWSRICKRRMAGRVVSDLQGGGRKKRGATGVSRIGAWGVIPGAKGGYRKSPSARFTRRALRERALRPEFAAARISKSMAQISPF